MLPCVGVLCRDMLFCVALFVSLCVMMCYCVSCGHDMKCVGVFCVLSYGIALYLCR